MSRKPLIIIGAGGHAKVLIDALIESEWEIVGLVDPSIKAGTDYMGFPVLGNDDVLCTFKPNEVLLVNGIGSLPGKKIRWQIASSMREKKYAFSKVIHPTATIAKNAILEEGSQIMAGAIIQPGAQIGRDSIINTGVIVDHDSVVGGNCHLAPGTTLSGGVTIGENTHIGTGVSVVQGVTIGSHSIVGAGTVVYRDISSNTTCIQSRQWGN